MSEIMPPTLGHRIRFTPLTDLVRGRVTGRLDWRRQITAVNLPAPIAALVVRIVRRTRLWRIEKIAVADELIAHFSDGLASGATDVELVRDFGDERAAAKLIRRAKKRNRAWPWHVVKYATRVVLIVLAIDSVLLIRFLLGSPTVSVDYLAQLNAPIERIPEADRAWPLYREAIIGLALGKEGDKSIDDPTDDSKTLTLADAHPGDPEWPNLTAWLDAHKPGFDTLRQAAKKPALGFVLGPNGAAYDPAIGFPDHTADSVIQPGVRRGPLDDSLVGLLLPDLNALRLLSIRLSADLRYAREQGDASRLIADLDAMHGMAMHLRGAEPVIVTRLVAINIHSRMLADLRETIIQKPALLSDADLIRLAHRTGTDLSGNAASAFIDLSVERTFSSDIIQRIYTDNGHGDGRLSPEAIDGFEMLSSAGGAITERSGSHLTAIDHAATFAIGSVYAAVNSRRDNIDELQRMYGLLAADLDQPLYALDPEKSGEHIAQARLDEIRGSAALRAKFVPVLILTPSMAKLQPIVEKLIAARDGTLVALALELYHRRHDDYPRTLDELTPPLLPAVPKDRITGEPIRYRLIDGKPVVYSVGADRDDDGGRPAVDKAGRALPDPPAEWPAAADNSEPRADGDWILFDGRASKASPKP